MMNKPNINAPSHHEWVLTEDGSWTIYSKRYQEAAHSIHGAVTETKLRFTNGCNLEELMNYDTNDLNIFEVGYGLGIGALETISLWISKKRSSQLTFISCEIDIELINWCIKYSEIIFKNTYSNEAIEVIKNLNFIKDQNIFTSLSNNNLRLIIIAGDIVNNYSYLEKFNGKIQCIFQDAYSPKKNPELWTVTWFQRLRSLCTTNGKLSTYSSSQSIRKNLEEAGFKIENGPGFGKKKSSTFAYPK